MMNIKVLLIIISIFNVTKIRAVKKVSYYQTSLSQQMKLIQQQNQLALKYNQRALSN